MQNFYIKWPKIMTKRTMKNNLECSHVSDLLTATQLFSEKKNTKVSYWWRATSQFSNDMSIEQRCKCSGLFWVMECPFTVKITMKDEYRVFDEHKNENLFLVHQTTEQYGTAQHTILHNQRIIMMQTPWETLTLGKVSWKKIIFLSSVHRHNEKLFEKRICDWVTS